MLPALAPWTPEDILVAENIGVKREDTVSHSTRKVNTAPAK